MQALACHSVSRGCDDIMAELLVCCFAVQVVIFGPLPGHLGASLATATDPVSIGQSCLASTQTTGSINQDYCREQLMLAHKKGLVYVINTDFQTMVRTSNIEKLGEKCYDVSVSRDAHLCVCAFGFAQKHCVGRILILCIEFAASAETDH